MKKLFRIFLILVLLAAGAVGYSVYRYNTPMPYAGTATVFIPLGSGTKGTLQRLHLTGVIPAPKLILLPMLMSVDYKALKAGEYEFAVGMTPRQIIEKVISGDVIIHKVTIPEGFTSYQVRRALLEEPLLTDALPPTILEGSVLPDTVHFQRGEARSDVLGRMQRAGSETLAELWDKRAEGLPYTTPTEALIMASIVERETGEVDERALVAGVFVNRLRKGMLLQTDPSVIYGIEVQQGGKPLERLLTTNDLKRDTPYNTYTRAGLPPTPICNPGRKAIEAALNPASTNYLYFVATGNGGHRFAETLKEHEANVVEYRKAMKVLEANAPPKPEGPPAKR